MTSAIIIGGGYGGLVTGALLARHGYKVTVLEKNVIVGGGLQCFRRHDKIFETGMHVMGGFGPDGTLRKLCSYLGILDRLHIHHLPDECMDEVYDHHTGRTYRIPSGRDRFVERMSEYFPHEADAIRRYVDRIYDISYELPMFRLRPQTEDMPIHSEDFYIPATRLIERYITDPALRLLLAWLNPLYSGAAESTPAYIHAVINVLYINGSYRFEGGSQQFADALVDLIRSHGGEVIANSQVSHVEVQNREVQYVQTRDGSRYTADTYISAIHPVALVDMMTPGAFSNALESRLKMIPNTMSSFSLYIDLKPDMMPYVDHTCYYYDSLDVMWYQGEEAMQDAPTVFMYMTPPEVHQGKYASRLLVHTLMSYDKVKQWEHTAVGRRGADYEAWKHAHTARILDKMERVIPGIRSMIQHVYAASPLTVRDFYNTKEGCMFGYRKDANNMMLSHISIRTKVHNLLMTGQNINLHGCCGVPISAILTAEQLLGKNTIVNEINEFFK